MGPVAVVAAAACLVGISLGAARFFFVRRQATGEPSPARDKLGGKSDDLSLGAVLIALAIVLLQDGHVLPT